MRLGVLGCVVAALALAQRDPFAGVFVNDKITLELKGAGGKYTGTLTVQGQSFPATAVAAGASSASGTFTAAGRAFPFTLAPYGNGFRLSSEGSEYLLVRKVEAATTPATAAGRTGENPAPPDLSPSPPSADGQAKTPALDRLKPVPPTQSGIVGYGPSIVGYWRNATGYAKFNADGTGTIDGQDGRYQIRGDQITLMGAQGQVTLPFSVEGDRLTLMVGGNAVVLNRAKEETGAGSVHMELVGKWCWMSQTNATNGGARQSNRCITLNANGTYQYAGLTDSYNPYGGATSQSSDSGTWSATDTTLTARSASGRVTVYRLEKRNHPKNKDPMIVLNGDTFVTYYNKPPW